MVKDTNYKANRGLGLEFVERYLESGDDVITTYRNEESSFI